MAFVLCTGLHPGLLHTRRLVLEKAGHKVVCALSESQVVSSCEQVQFDVVVIGQGGDCRVKRDYLALIRKNCPSARVLEVYTADEGIMLEDADEWLESPASPRQLADRVGTLAHKKKSLAQAAAKS